MTSTKKTCGVVVKGLSENQTVGQVFEAIKEHGKIVKIHLQPVPGSVNCLVEFEKPESVDSLMEKNEAIIGGEAKQLSYAKTLKDRSVKITGNKLFVTTEPGLEAQDDMVKLLESKMGDCHISKPKNKPFLFLVFQNEKSRNDALSTIHNLPINNNFFVARQAFEDVDRKAPYSGKRKIN